MTTLRRWAACAKELSFFEAVPRHFEAGHEFEVHVALLDGEVVAGLLVFLFNDMVEYFTPAVRHDHRSEQPLALLLVEAMAAAAQRGVPTLELGRNLDLAGRRLPLQAQVGRP